MNVTGTSTLSFDRATVWRALNDPAVLVRTIPGCQRLESIAEDAYTMTVSAGVGSIKGVYDGQVRLTDREEPGSFRMHAEGAGAPGTIGADVLVTLEDAPDGGTALTYDAEAVVGGMIGGVGQRMLAGVSKRMAAEFFRNVDAALAESPPVAASGVDGATEPSTGEPSPGTLTGAAPAGAAPAGAVFTAPRKAASGATGFGAGVAVGVAAGAAAALAGAVVGAWIATRRQPR